MANRRKFSSCFKTKVVLAALKEQSTMAELAQKFQLHPNQISQWKREFLEKYSMIFEQDSKGRKSEEKGREEQLLKIIGEQKVELDFFKKSLVMKSLPERKKLIDKANSDLSISRQCKLLALNRSTFYYQGNGESALNLELMRLMDEHYLDHPYKGAGQMYSWVKREKGFRSAETE